MLSKRQRCERCGKPVHHRVLCAACLSSVGKKTAAHFDQEHGAIVIVALDLFHTLIKEPKVLVSEGFASTRWAVAERLEVITGLFNPTGYGIVSNYPMMLWDYGKEYTWYYARWQGRNVVIAAVEKQQV